MGDSDSDREDAISDQRPGGAPVKSKKKTLAQGVKDKLLVGFLRKRTPELPLSGLDALEKPPPDVALTWSRGFLNLLNHKYGLELFRQFTRSEFSNENIEFWIACEEYKNSKDGSYLPTAQNIYTDFVAVQAPREVNLDSKTRLKTLEDMQSPDRETFETAQRRIQNLMEKDSYPRFLSANIYQDMLGDHRHKLKLKS